MKITSHTKYTKTHDIGYVIAELHSEIIEDIKYKHKVTGSTLPFDKLPLNFETKITPITYNSSTCSVLVTIICRYRLDEVL